MNNAVALENIHRIRNETEMKNEKKYVKNGSLIRIALRLKSWSRQIL